MKIKVKIAIIVVMILVCGVLLYANPNNNNRGNDKYSNAENILNDSSLNLTSSQKSAISACIRKHRTEGAEINKKIAAINKQIGEEMREHLVSGKAIDRDKIKKLIVDKKMLEADMEYLTIMIDLEIASSLDEKQKAVLRKQHRDSRQRERQ